MKHAQHVQTLATMLADAEEALGRQQAVVGKLRRHYAQVAHATEPEDDADAEPHDPSLGTKLAVVEGAQRHTPEPIKVDAPTGDE